MYTFFGPGLPHPPSIKSIVSVAYPIICYDDSPFWSHLSKQRMLRQRLINFARKKRLSAADHLIVELRMMRDRLASVPTMPAHDFHVVPPSPSEFVDDRPYSPGRHAHTPTFLVLSGVAQHKNLWRLPELAVALRMLTPRFRFVITTDAHLFADHLSARSRKAFQVTACHFDFRGTVAPDEIGTLYEEADYLLSLSDLESFSNNYMEAWKAGVPLIASDRDFAREICGESAIAYLEPHDPEGAAQQLNSL